MPHLPWRGRLPPACRLPSRDWVSRRKLSAPPQVHASVEVKPNPFSAPSDVVQPDLTKPKARPPTLMVKIDPRTRFALYAVAVFATHWPALVLPSVVPVSRRFIHFVAQTTWLALLSSV